MEGLPSVQAVQACRWTPLPLLATLSGKIACQREAVPQLNGV
jgi:hypothetical protein